MALIFLDPPSGQVRLSRLRLADHDAPVQGRQIGPLARKLRDRLSAQCGVGKGRFDRQSHSHDVAQVSRFLEKLQYRTKPRLLAQPRDQGDVMTALEFAG